MAIASLWSVSDASTQALMNEFYRGLATKQLTKAEAMQQAQIGLIQNNPDVVGEVANNGDARPSRFAQQGYTPYYWSPFILIGNGL